MILKLSYLALALLMSLILLIIGFKAIRKTFPDKGIARRKRIVLSVSLLAWHLYILTLASTGILINYGFPPRFFLLLILPAFIFTGVFIYRNRRSSWIQNIPPHWLIYYQSFRILIETLFVFSVARGILHYHVTIEGYNYDMVFAFTALIMAVLFRRKIISSKAVLLWNYAGLAVIAFIIFLFLSTTYLPELYGSKSMLLPRDFVLYPYVLVPAFLMPSAVFIHVLSLVQLGRKPACSKSQKTLEVQPV